MKTASCVLALVSATCAPIYGQTGPTGTWRIDDVGPSLPTLVLRVDGSTLTGTVRVGGTREITEGHLDGNTITFKVTGPSGDLTMTFRGKIDGDQIAFTREALVRDGAVIPAKPNFNLLLFPPQFTAKRVSTAELTAADVNQIAYTDQIRGVEFAAAVNLPEKDVKAVGTLFVPQRVSRVRSVIVVIHYGIGEAFFADPQVRRLAEKTESGLLLAAFPTIATPISYTPRNASLGGADGLLMLLQRLAQESGHPELADSPLLFWAHSGAGPFGTTFAALHAQRTIAFVRYQSGPVTGGELRILSPTPGLFIAEQDSPSVVALWKSGRALGAPWTYAVQIDASHGSLEFLKKANDLAIPWITAVLGQRLSADGGALRAVTDGSAWLGNNQTRAVARYATFAGSKSDASWLPDEATAHGWRSVLGAAAAK